MYKKIYGFFAVKNLLKYKSKYIKLVYILKGKNNLRIDKIKKLSLEKNISLVYLNNKDMNKLLNRKLNFQGIIALVKNNLDINNTEIDFYKLVVSFNEVFILVLDKINNPYNLGSCIRTAVSFGVNMILVSKYKSVSINNNIVHKVSMGSIYKVFLFEFKNLYKIINFLKLRNFFIVGSSCENKDKNLFHFNFKKLNLLVLILGSENKGLSFNLKKCCDVLLYIPMVNISSLNVSVANGIFISEIKRQQNNYIN